MRTVKGEAFVVLEIEQPGAEVFVDGDRISVTVPGDNKPVEIQVEPGQHKLRISKDGFVAVTRDIELKTGKSDAIRVRLEPVPKAAPKEVPVTVPADALRRADIPEAVLASIGGGDPKRLRPSWWPSWAKDGFGSLNPRASRLSVRTEPCSRSPAAERHSSLTPARGNFCGGSEAVPAASGPWPSPPTARYSPWGRGGRQAVGPAQRGPSPGAVRPRPWGHLSGVHAG